MANTAKLNISEAMIKNYTQKLVLFIVAITLNGCEKSDQFYEIKTDLKNRLEAYYSFSSNANDESGNGYNGKIVNVSLIKDRFGKSNSAVNFPGIAGSKISTKFFGVNGDRSRTISLWYRQTVDKNNMSILFYGGDPLNGEQGFGIYVNGNSRNIGVFISNYFGSFPLAVSSNYSKIFDGKWHHFAFTYNNNISGNIVTKINIYIDGVLVPSDSITQNAKTDPLETKPVLPLVFGEYFQSTSLFVGDLDDVGFWSRALSQTEISYLFENDYKP